MGNGSGDKGKRRLEGCLTGLGSWGEGGVMGWVEGTVGWPSHSHSATRRRWDFEHKSQESMGLESVWKTVQAQPGVTHVGDSLEDTWQLSGEEPGACRRWEARRQPDSHCLNQETSWQSHWPLRGSRECLAECWGSVHLEDTFHVNPVYSTFFQGVLREKEVIKGQKICVGLWLF